MLAVNMLEMALLFWYPKYDIIGGGGGGGFSLDRLSTSHLQELKEQANKLKADGNESFKSGGMIASTTENVYLHLWHCLVYLLMQSMREQWSCTQRPSSSTQAAPVSMR